MKKIRLLSILLIVGFLANPLQAQEAKKELIYEWSNFDKGLATKPSPLDLPKGYSTICQNVRLDTEHKSLSKRPEIFSYGTMSTTEETTSIHRLYLKDGTTKVLIGTHDDELKVGDDSAGTFTSKLTVATADYRWSWVTWHNLAIGGDGYNSPVKTDGTDATYLGTLFGEDSGSGSGPAAGTYTYKIAFYTTTYTIITAVASAPVVNGAGDHDISLSMIPIGPDTYGGEAITGRKVYRNKLLTQGTWYLLATNGTIAENTSTTLTDTDLDAANSTEYPVHNGTTIVTWTPPKGKFVVVNNNRLMFANDPTSAIDTGPSTINYSKFGSHDLFEHTTDYFNIRKNDGDEITFIKNLLGRLCVGKTNTIQYFDTDGDDPVNDWSVSDPFSFEGCTAPYSVDNTPLGVFYVNWGGLWNFNGQHSKLLSDIITPTINDISLSNFRNIAGKYYKNKYYFAYTSKKSSKNDRCGIYDLITNSFSIDIIDINCFAILSGQNDWGKLYAGSSTDGEVYTYIEGSTLTVSHSTYDDFTGTWDDMGYFQPIEGSNSQEAVLEIRWDCTLDGMVDEVLTKDTTQVLLLHCDGADESTTFTDYEGKTVTAVNNAQIDTAQYKFATASGLFDGTGDYLTLVDVAAWDIGADDYAIEVWVRFNNLPGDGNYMTLVSQYEGATDYWQFTVLNTSGTYSLQFLFYGGGGDQTVTVDSTGLSTNTWYQLSMDKDGNDYYFFQSGVLQGAKQTNANSVDVVAGLLEIAGYNGSNNELNGWIDELRMTDGAVRHIAAYTVPAGEYPIIDEVVGDIDRPDTDGTYESTIMHMPGITAYNTLYWNETLSIGNDVYFELRGGTTAARCLAADDSDFTDSADHTTPSGSDISGEVGATAYEYTQYKITMSTDDIDESPTIDYSYGYTVKITYDILAEDMETTIPLEWESGETDLGYPGYLKTLRTVYCRHEGQSGDLILTFTTDENITDTFTIDLANDTKYYTERFTEGALTGELFKLNVYNSDMYPLKIKKVWVVFDIEPLV